MHGNFWNIFEYLISSAFWRDNANMCRQQAAQYVVPYIEFQPPLGIWFWQPSAYFAQTYNNFTLLSLKYVCYLHTSNVGSVLINRWIFLLNIWTFTEVASRIERGVLNFLGEILSENVEISNVTAELWAILVRIETIKILERSIFQFHNLGFSSQMEKCQI